MPGRNVGSYSCWITRNAFLCYLQRSTTNLSAWYCVIDPVALTIILPARKSLLHRGGLHPDPGPGPQPGVLPGLPPPPADQQGGTQPRPGVQLGEDPHQDGGGQGSPVPSVAAGIHQAYSVWRASLPRLSTIVTAVTAVTAVGTAWWVTRLRRRYTLT